MTDDAVRRSFILGTAGHIDHGKSSLVRALTGIDPDRLPEEKARGMTIELGFARLDAPGVRFGIVDVPGHERFIRTMVSGATGIDLAMLVVAADDGVMPQTREHVDILDLLMATASAAPRGVIALNKCDLADASRLAVVTQYVRNLAAGTVLQDWPIVSVSAVTRQGLDELVEALRRIAMDLPPRGESAVFRLAIDRVFAVAGRGTVVTGSVLSGSVAAGAALELLPSGIACRVREVQSHGTAAEAVRAGQRAALNLTGIDRDRIGRGDELCTPGYLTPTRYLDVRLRVLTRHTPGLVTFRRVRVCTATSEHIALVALLDAAVVPAGGAALAQLRFREPVVASHGQRFVLREENGEATVGGGVVLRPVARRIGRRDAAEIAGMMRLEQAEAGVRLAEAMRTNGFAAIQDIALACRAGLEPADVAATRGELRREGVLVSPASGSEVHWDVLDALRGRAIAFLLRHHERAPGEPGVPVERLGGWLDRRSAVGVGRALMSALQQEGEIVLRGPFVAHRSFRPALSPEDEKLMSALLAELAAAGLDSPPWEKLRCVAGQSKARQSKLLELARGDPRLVQLAPQHFAATEAVERFRACVTELGRDGRKFTLAEVRDALKLSRRPVQAMLEYFDRVRVTRRVGDERTLIGPARRTNEAM